MSCRYCLAAIGVALGQRPPAATQPAIRAKLEAVSPEARQLLEDYAEAAGAVQSMEYSAILRQTF